MKQGIFKNDLGITLVALVITIIVLIILAGVTLVILLDENGLINRANQGKLEYELSSRNEQDQIQNAEDFINTIIGNNNLTIPEGFTPTEDSGETIEEGIVVSDSDGNEFVWIPVKTPTIDVSSATTNNEIKQLINNQVNIGNYPMSMKLQDGNYVAVLYNFGLDINTTPYKVKITPIIEDVVKEPNVVTGNGTEGNDYDALQSNIDIMRVDLTNYQGTNIAQKLKNYLQEEYNEMVKSVISKKGFWCGRYETSMGAKVLEGNDNIEEKIAQSKKDEYPITASDRIGVNSWYGLYNLQKNQYRGSNKVKSSMIWGSQWDQIMIWMKDIENPNPTIINPDLPQAPFYILDSTGLGNYKDDNMNTLIKTGSQVKYKLKNIFDLAGNLSEWTLEIDNTIFRVSRGGNYSSFPHISPMNSRTPTDVPTSTDLIYGSRLVLY